MPGERCEDSGRQHPDQASQQTFPSSTSPQGGTKRPWLPLKHVIGLIAVFAFIVGGIAGSEMLISARSGQMDREAAALAEKNSEEIYSAMSMAMLEGEREAFIKWGEGEARDHLARIWDETKKIGWTVGMADEVFTDEELSGDDPYDPQRPKADGMLLAFDLGFTQQRFSVGADGPEPDCAPDSLGCGILTQSFEYDVTVDGGDDDTRSHRIVEIGPRKPMPWDDPAGVYVVRSDNAVVFGYADEAARVDAVAGTAQTAAAGVLQTEIATSGYADVPGFPAFITDDSARYQDAVYGVGEHRLEVDRDWEENGVALVSPPLDVTHGASEAARERGVLLEPGISGGQSGSLAAFNGKKVQEQGSLVLRLAAHEFAHALEMDDLPALPL